MSDLTSQVHAAQWIDHHNVVWGQNKCICIQIVGKGSIFNAQSTGEARSVSDRITKPDLNTLEQIYLTQ